MRIERVVLEHHRDVPVLRLALVHHCAVDQDAPGGDILQPGDHAQNGALAAAAGADQDDELAVRDLEVDAMHDFGSAEAFAHPLQR